MIDLFRSSCQTQHLVSCWVMSWKWIINVTFLAYCSSLIASFARSLGCHPTLSTWRRSAKQTSHLKYIMLSMTHARYSLLLKISGSCATIDGLMPFQLSYDYVLCSKSLEFFGVHSWLRVHLDLFFQLWKGPWFLRVSDRLSFCFKEVLPGIFRRLLCLTETFYHTQD